MYTTYVFVYTYVYTHVHICVHICGIHVINWSSLVAQMVKNLPAMRETWV